MRRLSGDRDETIDHIITECSKLARKEYKTTLDWVGKVIHRELCKKLKFDHTTKWCMHKPEAVRMRRIKLTGIWRYRKYLMPARISEPEIIT